VHFCRPLELITLLEESSIVRSTCNELGSVKRRFVGEKTFFRIRISTLIVSSIMLVLSLFDSGLWDFFLFTRKKRAC